MRNIEPVDVMRYYVAFNGNEKNQLFNIESYFFINPQ